MKKLILLMVLVVLGLATYFYLAYWPGLKPALSPAPGDITKIIEEKNGATPSVNNTGFPLKLPAGFSIEILAKNLPGARDIVQDSYGNLWVSETNQGKISFISFKDGQVENVKVVLQGLNKPHGLVFSPDDPFVLYFAEEDKISRVVTYAKNLTVEKIVALPTGGRHTTRSLIFDKNNNLLVSIGSSCDVCHEEDKERATIMKVDLENKKLLPYAVGLRNSVFMTTNPKSGEIWATEMGRDFLGDNLPPDEVNIIQEGKNYGWPTCYGKNIHDTQFDKNTYIRNPCLEPFETPSFVDLPAHSAPLGLAFLPLDFPLKEYAGDLLVVFHGSWNRSIPTGYKVVRFKLDSNGKVLESNDFVSGWLTDNNQSLGRPAGILALPNGLIYLTDDKAGVVYKIQYQN